jgi:hypothetical protein
MTDRSLGKVDAYGNSVNQERGGGGEILQLILLVKHLI